MKKTVVSLLLLVLLFVLGCTKTDTPFLEYQSKNFDSTAKLEVNGQNYTVNIQKTSPENFTLTFTSPDTISGVSIEKKGDELFFSSGNVHIPMKENSNISAETIKLFNLSKEDMISTSTDSLGGVKVNIAEFKCDYGNVKLYLSADTSLPVLIEANIKGNSVKLSFSSFAVKDI